METRNEVLEAKIEALRKDVERLEKQFNEELGRVEKRFTEDIIRTEKQIYEGMKRLEQRMGTMEQKQEASAVEVARQFTKNSEQVSSQFAESNKQMIEMQTRVKTLGEKVDTSHAQQFSLLQSATQQISDISSWMRTMIDKDKEADNQLVQGGMELQKERENHSRNMQLKFWGGVAAVGTFIATVFTLAWNYFTKP